MEKEELRNLYTPPPPHTAQQPPVGQGRLIIEATQSNSDTPVGGTPLDE